MCIYYICIIHTGRSPCRGLFGPPSFPPVPLHRAPGLGMYALAQPEPGPPSPPAASEVPSPPVGATGAGSPGQQRQSSAKDPPRHLPHRRMHLRSGRPGPSRCGPPKGAPLDSLDTQHIAPPPHRKTRKRPFFAFWGGLVDHHADPPPHHTARFGFC